MIQKTLGDRTERLILPRNIKVGEKFELPITENFSRKEEVYSVNTLGNKTYVKTLETDKTEDITTHRFYEIKNKVIRNTSTKFYDNLEERKCFLN